MMRRSPTLLVLVFSLACAPESSSSPPAPEDSASETEEDSGLPTDDSAEDSAEDGALTPCGALESAAGVCCWLMRQDDASTQIAAVDAAVGGEGVAALTVTGFEDRGVFSSVDSLSQMGDQFVGTLHRDETPLLSIDALTGAATLTATAMDNAAAWRGEDPTFAGGLLTVRLPDTLVWYEDLSHAQADEAGVTWTDLDITSSRLAVSADTAWLTWHTNDTVEEVELPAGTPHGAIDLGAEKTWVWGLSVVGDTLYTLDDGRIGDTTGPQRINAFDVTTGEALGSVDLDTRYGWGGLDCQAE